MWILAVVVLVIAGFLIPQLGRVLLALAGIALLLTVTVGVFAWRADEKSAAQNRVAESLISATEIEFADLMLVTQGGGQRLRGRMRNRSSQHSLSSVTLKLTFSDCLPNGQCEVISEVAAYVGVSVPPGQAREINEYVADPGELRPKGRISWSYAITAVRADLQH